MRVLLLTGLLTGAAFAQEPAPKPLPPAMRNAFRAFTVKLKAQMSDNGVTVMKLEMVQPKTCAVPLKNVLSNVKPGKEPMPVFTPQEGKFAVREVQVPAPSCDDMKK